MRQTASRGSGREKSHLAAHQIVPRTKSVMADVNFAKEFLDAHNEYPAKHQAPSLTLSRDLCSSAQAWADHLLSIKTPQPSHCPHGENLYYAWCFRPKPLNGKEVVDKWYNEINAYNFDSPGIGSNTGYFTKVVWKNTKEVGVGLATDGQTVFVVGQYSPAGNKTIKGYFEDNILPPA